MAGAKIRCVGEHRLTDGQNRRAVCEADLGLDAPHRTRLDEEASPPGAIPKMNQEAFSQRRRCLEAFYIVLKLCLSQGNPY